ncbi:hypothetical protein B9Q31_02240 [Enterobacter kobei]|uniref:hypothetical protein n=1 Tax=Enterobacter kobei TaxID=208224 RepID=UPI000C1F1EC2|nr:hypothetical protein [Enterobacter kobei]MBT1798801.1 hypothetical protein [Enterobacter kobei]MBW7698077.1 hypothetical protein [Enterobacter kobei]MBW7774421.1 hypothetical protein [Enterobacter kobei]PJD62120.1 hypothetical protein B9Q31_02240 [Enterobacter kobei]
MKEFKGTKGEWEIMMDDDEIKVIQSSSLENGSGWRSYVAICEEVQCIEDANLIAAAPYLLEALQWALPLAEVAIESHRQERVKCGHMDISGVRKDGVSWVGIYQDEIDSIERARAAISKALGEE